MYNIFLGKKGEVADLVTQGRYLSYLTKRFRRVLSENIAPHIHVAGVRGNILIITASSSAWATRIKLQARELALLASQEILELQSVTEIKIKIIPQTEAPVVITPEPRKISIKASNDLTAMANSIDNDALKSSLLRLANRCKQKTKKNE